MSRRFRQIPEIEGDKYWYTQADVDRFLRRFHYEAFASGIMPSDQEGGSHV